MLASELPPAPPSPEAEGHQESGTVPQQLEVENNYAGDASSAPVDVSSSYGSNDFVATSKKVGRWLFNVAFSIGEVLANIIGLNDSKYQDVIDSMNEEEWKIANKVAARRKAEIEGRPFQEMEGGAAAGVPKPPTVNTTNDATNRS